MKEEDFSTHGSMDAPAPLNGGTVVNYHEPTPPVSNRESDMESRAVSEAISKLEGSKLSDSPSGELFRCCRCKESKGREFFYRNKNAVGGVSLYCRECMLSYQKGRMGKRVMKLVKGGTFPELEEQRAEVRGVIECLMENPRMTTEKIGKRVGIPTSQVKYIMQKNDYVYAVRAVATQKMSNLIPMAIASFRESLGSTNGSVKLASSTELLKSEGLLGPSRVEVSGGISELTVKQLQEIVSRAKDLESQTIIEAELA